MSDSDSIQSWVRSFFPKAKENLENDGFLAPAAILVFEDNNYSVIPGGMLDINTKEAWICRVRLMLRGLPVKYCFLIMEAWIGKAALGVMPAALPGRQEAISVYGEFRDGRKCLLLVPFLRAPQGVIWLEEQEVAAAAIGGQLANLFQQAA